MIYSTQMSMKYGQYKDTLTTEEQDKLINEIPNDLNTNPEETCTYFGISDRTVREAIFNNKYKVESEFIKNDTFEKILYFTIKCSVDCEDIIISDEENTGEDSEEVVENTSENLEENNE